MNKEIELKPCREAFEARYQRDITHQRENEGYRNQFIQQDWVGFQAAWEHKHAIEAQLQAENVRLREENAKLRQAEWYYDPKDPEYGHEDSLIFTENKDWGSAIQLHGARTVTTDWHIFIPKTFDDNGDVDDYEEYSFATEQEALDAYKAALQHNEAL